MASLFDIDYALLVDLRADIIVALCHKGRDANTSRFAIAFAVC